MKINLLLTTFFVLFLSAVIGQERTIKKLSPATTSATATQTPDEVHVSETTKEFALEVYKNCLQYTEEAYLLRYQTYMDRIVFLSVNQVKKDELQLLSQIKLKNKCNEELKYDSNHFSTENFNPLKYQFNFNSESDQFFRIDGTDFVVQIKAKK